MENPEANGCLWRSICQLTSFCLSLQGFGMLIPHFLWLSLIIRHQTSSVSDKTDRLSKSCYINAFWDFWSDKNRSGNPSNRVVISLISQIGFKAVTSMRLFCRSDCQSFPASLQVSFLSYFRVTVADIKYHYQKQAGAGMGLFCLYFKSTAKEVSVEIKAEEKVG